MKPTECDRLGNSSPPAHIDGCGFGQSFAAFPTLSWVKGELRELPLESKRRAGHSGSLPHLPFAEVLGRDVRG